MSEWGRGTVYVIHCAECCRTVKQKDKDADEEMPCPPPRDNTPLPNGAPMVAFGSHKQDRNYPQVAPNLPGSGVVTSWSDYQGKLKASGQGIVGTTTEARQRSKALKRKPRDPSVHRDFKA